VNGQVANLFGSSSDRIGVQGIAQSLKARKHNNKFTVLRGNPMQDMILSRFSAMATQVQTSNPVAAINYGSDTVVITTTEGKTFEANKVIVTVPISILKAGSIRFSPGLPAEKNTALSRMNMDGALRIVLEFKRNFWGEDTTFVWGGTSAIQIFNTGVGRSRFFQTTTITVYGPKATELASLGTNLIPVLLAELDLFYNGQATQFVRRDLQSDQIIAVIQDWSKEEFIRGGISYLLPNGSTTDRETLSKPVGTRLFFAGEATDTTGDAGTINGALASAERVALQVIDSILAEG
jgi:monoamine oxidase